jgi:SNF2 family DNA or RNA helicase
VAEILVDEFMRRKVAATFIHGGTSTSRRVRRIREGQKAAREGRPHLLAATLATTSTGINLTYADVGAFAELTHVPHFFAQAEKRLDRHGQTRMVSFYYYIAKSTGDELILAHVINKLDVEDSVLGENDEGLKDALDKDPKGQAALDELYESVLKTMKRKNT